MTSEVAVVSVLVVAVAVAAVVRPLSLDSETIIMGPTRVFGAAISAVILQQTSVRVTILAFPCNYLVKHEVEDFNTGEHSCQFFTLQSACGLGNASQYQHGRFIRTKIVNLVARIKTMVDFPRNCRERTRKL